jgi:galactose-1-phosphate uridylyltransferase
VCVIRLKLLKSDEITTTNGWRHVAPNKHKIPVAKFKEIRILTIWILTKENVVMWSEFSWLRMVGSCKHANKYFGSING